MSIIPAPRTGSQMNTGVSVHDLRIWDIVLFKSPAFTGTADKLGVIEGMTSQWQTGGKIDIRCGSIITCTSVDCVHSIVGKMNCEQFEEYKKPFFKTVRNDEE